MDIFLDKIAPEIDSLETCDTDINEQWKNLYNNVLKSTWVKKLRRKRPHIVSSTQEEKKQFV